MNENEERLVCFGLPSSFPLASVPFAAAKFAAEATRRGMNQAELLELAKARGFDPCWKPLPDHGEGVYGLGLVVDGLVVPFMVRMARPN